MSNPVPDFLALKNTHPRDEFISFDEGPHIYTVHGDSSFTSVTTWNHSHFEHFDSDGIIDKILTNKRRNDPTYKYYGKTKKQIKADWDKNRDEAAAAGTKMHYDIECYYNEMDVNNDSIEYSWFLRYGKKVTALYLICLHPDSGYKTYDRIEVQILDKEIKDLFEFRKTQLEQI